MGYDAKGSYAEVGSEEAKEIGFDYLAVDELESVEFWAGGLSGWLAEELGGEGLVDDVVD